MCRTICHAVRECPRTQCSHESSVSSELPPLVFKHIVDRSRGSRVEGRGGGGTWLTTVGTCWSGLVTRALHVVPWPLSPVRGSFVHTPHISHFRKRTVPFVAVLSHCSM